MKMLSLTLIALMALSFTIKSDVIPEDEIAVKVNCFETAIEIHDMWTNAGFSNARASQEADQAYDQCIAATNIPGEPAPVIVD